MSEIAVRLEDMPAVIMRERTMLAEIIDAVDMASAERRAAAIADLTKRAQLPVPIQNEATFYRAEALERIAVLVDEEEKPKGGRGKTCPNPGRVSKVKKQRISEGRSLAATGARIEAEEEARQHPDKPVSMDQILKRAKRRERENGLREQRAVREQSAREQIAETQDVPDLVVADLRDWRPTGVASIVTDPPYVGDSIPLYEALRDFAVDVLPEGGPLVVMTWQAILPDVIRALEHPELAYRWCVCWRYANTENTADHARRVFDCWKPVLVYHRGTMPIDAAMIRDEISNKAGDKDFHEWGQSVDGFERLVKTFSQPGDVVCDPFLGGGTTAVAALSQARRFAGCDVDSAAIETTRQRLES